MTECEVNGYRAPDGKFIPQRQKGDCINHGLRRTVRVIVECTLTPDCDAWWLGMLEPETKRKISTMDKERTEYTGKKRGPKKKDVAL